MPTLTKPVIAILITTAMLPMAALSQTETTPPSKEEVSTVGIMPYRGMTMEQVKQRFGEPTKIIAAVGRPPITRWVYEGFIVYFEKEYVIHSLATANGDK